MQMDRFFIDGRWVDPISGRRLEVVNPATEVAIGEIALASAADVDRAVAAAVRAFPSYSRSFPSERLALIEDILSVYLRRQDEVAEAISAEVGAPVALAHEGQAAAGVAHLEATIRALKQFEFQRRQSTTRIVYEPVGVCALITPWNWPINQIACKVLPALAAGCTMVLKPSELAPINAILWTEILAEAGVPEGVFNLINGDGPVAGAALSAHEDVDMVSFTGSTRAGVAIAKAGADSVKRVHQELGGKSANILLPGVNFEAAVRTGVQYCFLNSGQSCDAPTRMLVPRERQAEVEAIARDEAAAVVIGNPASEDTTMGPVISEVQWTRIQSMIEEGVSEGAILIAGGLGRPAGCERGHFVRPTIFGSVEPDMKIAREEVFGPVLAIIPYDDIDDAIRIANDSPYGLAAYVQGTDLSEARRVASEIRAGCVYLNYAEMDPNAPFGGFKQSGNGREFGIWGLHDFLEVKAIMGDVDVQLAPSVPSSFLS
jgi:aldehyde dehydrogenase (NAD+)